MTDYWLENAKKWGRQHGYKGDAGGWIRGPDGKAFCQGWHAFAHSLDKLIEREKRDKQREQEQPQ